MDNINQILQSIEDRVVAHGLALQALITLLGPNAKERITEHAEQVIVQGLQTSIPDDALVRIRAILLALVEP